MSLGTAIKERRKSRKLTMKDLALMSGVTSSLISQIESDKANPSINTLLAIAVALDTDISQLLQCYDGKKVVDSPVVRVNERMPMGTGDKKWTQHLLTHKKLEQLSVSDCMLQPGASSTLVPEINRHDQAGYEFALVISGKLRVDLEGQTYILNAGDAITFEANRSHEVSNAASGETEFFSVIIPG